MMNNIVMCHPEGQMSDRRKEKLNQSCYPYFKSTQKSASQGTTLEYTVPSDIHMFWESSSSSNTSSMNELLSFVLVGHRTPPNVSKYSDKIKRVVFFGHICRVETTMEIVSQLKQCESVEFILGSKDQLPIYHRDPFSPEKAKSSSNKTVKLVSIKSSCSQVKDSPELETHLRSHTRERPFVCSFCDKKFSNETNMKDHMSRHKGDTPFTCSLCGKGFAREGLLKRHKKQTGH